MISNFNFSGIFDSKNSKKFIVLGVMLLAIGTYCISRKNIGINVFSWGMGISFLYGAWLSLKNLNELTRYSDKKEINKARIKCMGLFVTAILLFIFPKQVNMLLSISIGLFLLVRELQNYMNYRRFSTVYFSTSNVLKLLVGILLIVSPLFLSRFLVSILSGIVIIFGIYFIVVGINIINREGNR